MILRFFFLFLGFGFAVAGGVSLVAFLNLLTMGNTWGDYFQFIIRRSEAFLFIIGIFIMWISIYFPSR